MGGKKSILILSISNLNSMLQRNFKKPCLIWQRDKKNQ